MTNSPYAAYIAFAHELADAAAAVTIPQFRNLKDVDNKLAGGDFDPVTIADRGAEQAIRDLIDTHHPSHAILGEAGERWATLAGAVLLAVAHIKNFRLCRQSDCDH